MKRYIIEVPRSDQQETTASSTNKRTTKQIRMVRLTQEYFRNQMALKGEGSSCRFEDDEDDDEEEDESNESSMDSVISKLGMAQSHQLPMFAQMFARIEQVGKVGISLKQMGTLFALDFYKSRRMGNNLQAHPDVVTVMKETNKGKTRLQTIALRRLLELIKVCKPINHHK